MNQSFPIQVSQSQSVFICHSSHDKPFLFHLVALLRMQKIEAWLDRLELKAGDGLLERISEQIAASACLIVAVSRHSAQSRWVTTELMQALRLEMEGKGPRVIPIKLDDSETPPYLTNKLYIDFSRTELMDDALRALVEAIRSVQPPFPMTRHDELEQELTRTTLREVDLRLAAQLCSNIHTAEKNVLLTAYRLIDDPPYRHVPPIRVLLFSVHDQFKCLRLQMYVSDTAVVVHCRHRFTLDPSRQRHLNPAAMAWNERRQHHVDYEVEYAADPERYIEEAVQHGFTRDKVANIIIHVASSVSIPLERVVFHSLGTYFPGVICIDSERRKVFPETALPVLSEIVVDLVNDYNTGRRSPWQFEDRDFLADNRGIIDEVTR
ncbi:toll/interleukin-1 receptor domain-containing protein [Nonomuraea sp. NN258]|uniref:toll/interleukin-1 receptor domain-containing protein n=1 Tax=Nonomuraea antri TaxID=2730852 RepID=UPI0015690E24|nr:toll/interleukin-1 receptor domain-containing protein [Nonomuraea antri]NRQ36946.1 toll/interleukin-1 receptor domain-containing protein [Nonomuraea antri]